jgi:acetoacetyl-CoA reductase
MVSRIALVTGGTRGIGRGCSLALKAAGYRVAANYGANDEKAKAFADESELPVYKWDVGNLEACEKGIAQVESDLGPIEILINNAAISPDRFMHKMPPETWRATIDTNLHSCFNMCHTIVPGMRKRKWGRIVFISSVNAHRGAIGETHYDASKAGMIGFAKALAHESGALGITVNAVAPGLIDTDMVASAPQEWRDDKVKATPMGRIGQPEDVANCVVFLVSEASDFITGATIDVNGGVHMR